MEKQPNMISRRKLLAALGAGVLLTATGCLGREVSNQNATPRSTQENHESLPAETESYPVHEDIITTVFWAGEDANALTNDSIHNRSSVWVEDWVTAYGGIDDPDNRCDGYKPCGFEPKENPFYFALPFFEYNDKGLKPASELEVIPWYDGKLKDGESILKNRWIKITYRDKTAYAQWEDAGPFGEDDAEYVFGTDRPKERRAGLDVSPAVADYLGVDGRANTTWQFVDESEVPAGPWKEIITTSGPQWK